MNIRLHPIVFTLLILCSSVALGATQFVTDELRINLRSGAGNEYRIVRVLDTGTRLETLETAGEWTRVRIGTDTGWVRSQYLTDERVAADRLEETRARLEQVEKRASALEESLAQAREELNEARARVQELSASNEELEQQLAAAEEGLQLSDENERLRAEATDLNGRIAELEDRIAGLADRSRKEWFMIGAGVLFAGMLSGIIVTRIPWRRRSGRDRLF